MKCAVWTAICLVAGAGAAFAQDPDKRIEELKKEFERSMKGLQEKFEQERGRLEKEFKAARERLFPEKREAPPAPDEKRKPRGVEEMLSEILKRVDQLEKRLNQEMPRLRELPKALPRMVPKDFDFKRFGGEGMPEEWKK